MVTFDVPEELIPQEEVMKAKKNVILSLNVLREIKEAQDQHGLKHGDYHRYRSYCSRRLHRVRSSLKQSTGRSKGMYLKKVHNQIIVDALGVKREPVRYLLVPLMSAERAWAYAMALKQEANTELRKKFHLVRRFRKAVSYAKNLESLCNEEPTVCDLRTKLEAQAYAAYMSGMYEFEVENWPLASEYLKKAQAIYVTLQESITEDEPLRVLYQQRGEELKPTLRYCAFNLNEQGAGDLMKLSVDEIQDEFLANKLATLLMHDREQRSSALSEVKWLGKCIPVHEEKVRTFLLGADEVLNEESTKLSKLEKMLFESRDCLQLLKEVGQEKSSLSCHVNYLRQRLSSKRAQGLIATLKADAELVRPYEIIISSLTDILSLPLRNFFGENEVNILFKQIETQILAFKAFRCYHIGRSGRLEWKESLAILHKASEYLNLTLKDATHLGDLRQAVEQLKTKVELEKFNLYANNFLEQKDNDVKDSTNLSGKPLIEQEDVYLEKVPSSSQKITHFPPEYQKTPCKPLFFDLALNHINFPSLEEEMGTQNKNVQGAGITNLVKGWFWKK